MPVMYAASRQLIYRVSSKVFSTSSTVASHILALHSIGRCFKNVNSLPYFSRCTSNLSIVKEIKTHFPASKRLRVETACDLKLKPVDPESTHQDYLFVRIFSPEISNYSVDIVESEDLVKIIGSFKSGVSCTEAKTVPLEIEVPSNHNVEVSNEQGNVSVNNIKSDSMAIKVKNGSINCKDISCGTMLFECLNGSVNCEGVVQGNTDIKVKDNGNVKGLNFQGGLLKIEIDRGEIQVASTYCDDSIFHAIEGNLFLKNIHQKNHISVKKGNINIAGLDGTLDALVREGNINLQVTQLNGNSYVEVNKGNVTLSLEKEDLCRLRLYGKTITLKDNLESLGKLNRYGRFKVFKSYHKHNPQQPTMKVVCSQGDVVLEKKSWIASMLPSTE